MQKKKGPAKKVKDTKHAKKGKDINALDSKVSYHLHRYILIISTRAVFFYCFVYSGDCGGEHGCWGGR